MLRKLTTKFETISRGHLAEGIILAAALEYKCDINSPRGLIDTHRSVPPYFVANTDFVTNETLCKFS